MYMLGEIKEVVKRYLLARLIKNSVNEAALSPQIEQMCMKQQCGNPLHQPSEEEVNMLLCWCVCVCEKGVL